MTSWAAIKANEQQYAVLLAAARNALPGHVRNSGKPFEFTELNNGFSIIGGKHQVVLKIDEGTVSVSRVNFISRTSIDIVRKPDGQIGTTANPPEGRALGDPNLRKEAMALLRSVENVLGLPPGQEIVSGQQQRPVMKGP